MIKLQATAVAAALTVWGAACGGSPSAHTTTSSGWVAFSGCMRANGVTKYPDPSGSGAPPKRSLDQLGVSSTQLAAAQSTCRHLLPNGGQPPSAAAQQQVAANALRFSQCVRAHGVAGFPDPGSDGRIPDPATVGINQGSPKFETANAACAAFRPPYMPSNAAYNQYARTHPS